MSSGIRIASYFSLKRPIVFHCFVFLLHVLGNCFASLAPLARVASDTSSWTCMERRRVASSGCKHYRRFCRIRAPCCSKVFSCRHCHNEATLKSGDEHRLPRHEVKTVICSSCGLEQRVVRSCLNCGITMGRYFCGICKFYDNDVSKRQFHCKECGICRVGGKENFFHCKTCGCCYSNDLKENHVCVENSLRHDCVICLEYLFDSLKPMRVMKCGHTLHLECFETIKKKGLTTCPICSQPVCI